MDFKQNQFSKFSSADNLGLLVEDITSSSNRDQVPDISKKKALPDERKADDPQDIDSCTEESHNDLDAGTCPVKDKDTHSPMYVRHNR